MITKLVHIKNIGRMKSLDWKGLPELQRFTAIYGDNGSGKSTLASILRAARDQSTPAITERTSLGAAGGASVHIRTKTQSIQFNNTAWSQPLPDVDIFDQEFVYSNVYEGREIGPNQRANLYRLAIGDAQVRATKEIEAISARLKNLRDRQKVLEDELGSRSQAAGGSIEALRQTPPIAVPPSNLTEQRIRAQRLASQTDLGHLPDFASAPTIVQIDVERLQRLLDRSAEALSKDAVAAVMFHVATNLDRDGEAWLSKGTEYAARAQGDSCPFCGQQLAGSTLAATFPKYFDAAYSMLKDSIQKGQERVVEWKAFRGRFADIERANDSAASAWGSLTSLPSKPDVSRVGDASEDIAARLHEILADKLARPLDQMGADSRVTEVNARYVALKQTISEYGQWVSESHEKARKLRTGYKDEQSHLAAFIRRVDLGLLRNDAPTSRQLEQLDQIKAELDSEGQKKEAELENLKRAAATLTEAFVVSVNSVLNEFGASFKIQELEGKTTATRVNSDFELEVDGVTVKASSAKKGQPRAETILSEGDRTTLALAIFFSKLLASSDRSSRIVVLDDPFSSLDRNRRAATCQYIAELTKQVAQVILLSHDAFFLRDAIAAAGGGQELQLRQEHGATVLEGWSAADACRSDYFRRLEQLKQFAEGRKGSSVDEAKMLLRPVLEGFLKRQYPKAWASGDMLGDFIKKASDPIIGLNLRSEEVAKVVRWKNRFNPAHHAERRSAGRPADGNRDARLDA